MSKTKEKILLTALRLFAQDGYEAVSMSKIAGELGITKVHYISTIKISVIFLTLFLNMCVNWILNVQKKQVFPKKNLMEKLNYLEILLQKV